MKNEMIFWGLVLCVIGIAVVFAIFHNIVKWVSNYKIMKESTKIKIVHWVEKLLKIKTTKWYVGASSEIILSEKHSYQIQEAICEYVYSKKEYEQIEKDYLYRLVVKDIAEELLRNKVVKMEILHNPEIYNPDFVNTIRVTGKLKFVQQ